MLFPVDGVSAPLHRFGFGRKRNTRILQRGLLLEVNALILATGEVRRYQRLLRYNVIVQNWVSHRLLLGLIGRNRIEVGTSRNVY